MACIIDGCMRVSKGKSPLDLQQTIAGASHSIDYKNGAVVRRIAEIVIVTRFRQTRFRCEAVLSFSAGR